MDEMEMDKMVSIFGLVLVKMSRNGPSKRSPSLLCHNITSSKTEIDSLSKTRACLFSAC